MRELQYESQQLHRKIGGVSVDLVPIVNEILSLQPEWTHENTKKMARRGHLIRHSAPDWLRLHQRDLAGSMRTDVQNVIVEGRDGTGPKSEIPWFRFASREYSPRATDSWYCVYLFRADGSAAYLSLMCGSTNWNGTTFVPRQVDELRRLASWGRSVVARRLRDLDVHERISSEPLQLVTQRTQLGPAYEVSSAISIRYERTDLPSTERFLNDALAFAALLGDVYARARIGQEPGSLSPEALGASLSAGEAAGKRSIGGQGFRVSADERRSIEKAAMAAAREWLQSRDWDVIDRSASSPYDFECKRADRRMFVEVKGTTSPGSQIVLTKNEVVFHQRHFPNNALIVVSGIQLDNIGGANNDHSNVRVIMPWQISGDDLRAISYTYSIH